MNRHLERLLILFSVTLLSACSVSNVNSSTTKESSNIPLESKELRSPEALNHKYTYEEISSEGFKNFKNKMNLLSSKISEYYLQYDNQDNVALSPLSIELCLGLAYRCSEGITKEEIGKMFDIDFETFNQYYHLYFDYFLNKKYSYYHELMSELSLTNSIWLDYGFEPFENTLDELRDDYYSYSYEVDFMGNNLEANKALENFIKEKSNDLLNPHLELGPDTMMVLMNTLYLKDIWNEMGEELEYAEDKYRFKYDDDIYSSKLLLKTPYNNGQKYKGEGFEAFYAPTDSYKLYFIKPNEGTHIRDIFNKEVINNVIDSKNYIYKNDKEQEEYHTNVIFPEFKANTDVEISELLINDFGVSSLFDSRCDFSHISDVPLFCSEARHIAALEVNKTGIEGAAVTYMAMAKEGFDPEEYKKVYDTFIVDREFGYILTTKSNDIIFSGVVTNLDR